MADIDKDESQLIDDESPVEQPTTDEPEEIIEEAPEEQPEEPEPIEDDAPEPPEEQPPSRRENLRIKQVLEKIRQQSPQESVPSQMPQGMDYQTALNADPETIKQLEDDRRQYAESLYRQGVQQAESIQFHTRLEIDAPKAEAKFPQLDSKSPQFNPALADAVNTMYLNTVGFDPKTRSAANPSVRYLDFVEGIFEMVDEAAGQKMQQTKKNITQQAAVTGIRPDGSKAKKLDLSKDPGDMTNEELDAVLKTLPKSSR